jgi:competence protein ComEC
MSPRRVASRLRDWTAASLAEELAERAGFQWLAIAFAAGCLAYFSLPSEPAAWPVYGCAAAVSALAAVSYQRGWPWRATALLAACLMGASAAKLRVDRLQGPTIERAFSTELSGRVLDSDHRAERRPRIVLDQLASASEAAGELPNRIRLTLAPRQELPPLGARVAVRARLSPLAGPVTPGSYDPRRAAFFDGIGGSGFVLGSWTLQEGVEPVGGEFLIARIRAAMVARIFAAEPGEAGALAAALLVGERSALSAETNESLRISGLAHILSISGLHMMLISGTAFFVMRAVLALSPRLALVHPIRKWAALIALVVVTLYFTLSGGGAATLRAYVMAAIMFAAILLDRPAISMRNLALAAFVVLALEPEGIVEPGFQMSFAAVAALIAGWEGWRDRSRPELASGDGLPGLRLVRAAGAALGAVLLTSLVAGFATAPFSAYHFERIATYSLLGNLLAAPIVSAIIMPFGLLALVLLTVGLEALPLWVMARGIEVLLWISDWVASLPGAELSGPPMAPISLLMISAGLLWLCVWRLRWRLLGAIPIAAGILLVPILASPPDILISGDGKTVGVRDESGSLRISGSRAGSYVAEQFVAEAGGRGSSSGTLRTGVRCDRDACLLAGVEGMTVSHVMRPAAFLEDCRHAGLIVTALPAPPSCKAPHIIDGPVLARFGAHALQVRTGGPRPEFFTTTERGDTSRPWQTPSPARESSVSISASNR